MPTAAPPQYRRCCSTQDSFLSLVYSGSCTAAAMNIYIAAALHELQYTRDKRVSLVLRRLVYCGGHSLPWHVKFSLPQHRKISPFIRYPQILTFSFEAKSVNFFLEKKGEKFCSHCYRCISTN